MRLIFFLGSRLVLFYALAGMMYDISVVAINNNISILWVIDFIIIRL